MLYASSFAGLFRGLKEVEVIGGIFIMKINKSNFYRCFACFIGSLPTANESEDHYYA